MILSIIMLLISLLLEIVFNVFRGQFFFFILSIIVIISKYKKDNRMYLALFITGVLYDLFLTDLIFIHGIIFMFLYYINNYLLNKKRNILLMLLVYFLNIIIYSLFFILLGLITSNISIGLIIAILIRSIFINTIYFILMHYIYNVILRLIKNKDNNLSYKLNR